MHSNGLKLVYTLCDVDIDERLRWARSVYVCHRRVVLWCGHRNATRLRHDPNPNSNLTLTLSRWGEVTY